jgi:U4/U6 small nuclear ribonucleoprotein PRP4
LRLNFLAVDRDYYVGNAGGIAPEKASAIIQQMERKKQAAAIAVPTADNKVKLELRKRKEPITLFGEGPADRRERLRFLMLDAGETEVGDSDVDMDDSNGVEEEEFYTEGIPELLLARREIAEYSLPRAQKRIARQREEAEISLQKSLKFRRGIKARLGQYGLYGSQIAGDRPVSIARFSPNSEVIVAGNFGGGLKILSVPDLEERGILRGHTDRIGGIAWHPEATLSLSPEVANLATGGADTDIHLWSLKNETPLSTLSGHKARIARVEYHPSGKYLASASFDSTWRLWDLTTQKCLLTQEGHSREVYSVAFQNDGALVASGGLDSYGRVWDLRTGRTIMVLDGHIREITGLSWNRDGYRLISSSGDASCKVWDVRMVRCTATIGAHKSLVSDVRYFNGYPGMSHPDIPSDRDDLLREEGTYFVTSGFDGTVNVSSYRSTSVN